MNNNYKKEVDSVVNGNANPLEVYARLKDEFKILTDCIKEVEAYALDEAKKMDSNSFEFKGFKFEYRNGSARYSYKNIPEWAAKQDEIKDIEAAAKIAYSSYKKGITSLSADAEIIALPEVSYSKDSLIVKPLKQ